jgi:hypothetical protein
VRYEIQRIFTAATGMNNLSSADSFVLQLDSRDRVDGAFFQTPTGKLNALSSAADVKNAIETNFNPMRMSSTAMLVDVSRNELDSKRNTFEWLVTFKSFLGDVPTMTTNNTNLGSSSGTISVKEIQTGITEVQTISTSARMPFVREEQTITLTASSGTTVSGSFEVRFDNSNFKTVPYNASAEEMERAIESLSSIQHEIQTVRSTGGNPRPLGGTFTLEFEKQTTGSLRFDISHADMKKELEKLPNILTVFVSSEKKSAYNEYEWKITFVTELGNRGALVPDFSALTGSNAIVSVSETQPGILINDVTVKRRGVNAGGVNGASTWIIQFVDPVGNIPNLQVKNTGLHGVSPRVFVDESTPGYSPISGSFIVSFGSGSWVTTPSLDFDISARGMKAALEGISSVGAVDVMREDLGNGHRWTVTFVSNLGNLPMMRASAEIQEIQSVFTDGGDPTPLGGSFTLTVAGVTTSLIPFDASEGRVKASLERLSTVTTVDVHRFGPLGNGKYQWDIYFRSEKGDLPMISADGSELTGTSAKISVREVQKGMLKSLTGDYPQLKNEEKVAGLPSYTGFYVPRATTNYTMAVRQLQPGGLYANYFDNQWFMHAPVVSRVDTTIKFNWGTDRLTPYGRDYISVRWTGKIKPKTSETYTFFLHADDGARLWIDHVKVIDNWDQASPIERRATVVLNKDIYHDIKLEYKEERNSAFITLQWSSFTFSKQTIPPSQLYQASHIVGSPFVTAIIPGSADYPYTTAYGPGLESPVAGIKSKFTIQAKDLYGNNKTGSGRDSASDHLDGHDSFFVNVVGPDGAALSVTPDYIGGGAYACEYIGAKSGRYLVDIQLAGTNIYCGNGTLDACSPFTVTIEPGLTTHETSVATGIGLTDVVAGEIAQFTIQAKDAYGNNKNTGGEENRFKVELTLDTSDTSIVRGPNTTIEEVTYRGKVQDFNDGTGRYLVTYTAYRQGKYQLRIEYDGLQILTAANKGIQGGVSPAIPIPLIVHSLLHSPSSTATGNGLYNAIADVPDFFTVHAKDAFANDRRGDRTPNDVLGSGQGNDDAFLVVLKGPGDTEYVTSTAVITIEISDSSNIAGLFSVTYDGKETPLLQLDTDAASLQTAIELLHEPNPRSVQVSRSSAGGSKNGYIWTVTFTSHLEQWHPSKFTVDSEHVSPAVNATVKTLASNGAYPVSYTAWTKGAYEVHVTSNEVHIKGSPFALTVHDGVVHPETSTANGRGLMEGIAGDKFVFTVQAKDTRAYEQQTITTSAITVPIIREEQQVICSEFKTKKFRLRFRGEVTNEMDAQTAFQSVIKSELEQLTHVSNVSVTFDGIYSGTAPCADGIMVVRFEGNEGLGDVPPMEMDVEEISSTRTVIFSELMKGNAPFRKEVQVITCQGDGSFKLKYKKNGDMAYTTALPIDKTTNLQSLANSLNSLGPYVSKVSVYKQGISILVCDSNETFVRFEDSPGDLVKLEVVDSSMVQAPSVAEFISGVHPLWGTFTLSFRGMHTDPIPFDATAGLLKSKLEKLSTIGKVRVTENGYGYDTSSVYSGTARVQKIWTVDFDQNRLLVKGGDPTNVGPLPKFEVNDLQTDLKAQYNPHSRQRAPTVIVKRTRKGSSGNPREDPKDWRNIHVLLRHSTKNNTDISMYEEQRIACNATS